MDPVRVCGRGVAALIAFAVCLFRLNSFAAEAQPVTRETFVPAETDCIVPGIASSAGGIDTLHHVRASTPRDQQTAPRIKLLYIVPSAYEGRKHGTHQSIQVTANPRSRAIRSSFKKSVFRFSFNVDALFLRKYLMAAEGRSGRQERRFSYTHDGRGG